MNDFIFPRALMVAAKTFADKPKIVGEVLVALVKGDNGKNLSEVQRYILDDCREDIAARKAQRDVWREQKRARRAKGGN